ncbi:MAG: acyl-ACP--UDP-N-acetylglucosamine O-acyltransferase [Betaproteobacteria bacterium]|nr:acyl-ACP--UDP-N-acetylglucosamine O-acyltransferase [Betaproteobacteria bacterium]PWB65020.1 MAG: acyl-[acyl-carrier-protein]--UDP-N-acetylglucosamine O-acyltransferase [Betaproteobacteria bacterium]
MRSIHPTAIVDPRAQLGAGVRVGPYSVIDGDVVVGEGTSIGAHCVVTGHTTIGRDNRIFHFCSIGEANQDKKYRGEPTRLAIGDRNTIREYCSINRGTAQDRGETTVGNDNWIMAYCHIAHDCVVGDHTVFANNATLAGHVWIGDHTVLGGFTGVHQFVRVGAHVMAGVSSVVLQDIPPYVTVAGHPCTPHGINSEGLKRRGFAPEALAALKRAYKTLYKSGLTLADAKAELERQAQAAPEVGAIVEFLATSTRGIVR